MTQKLLSVALPVRNGANFLAAALDSILAQTFRDFELFVSDNASDDATPQILADYARRDPRVRVSRSAAPLTQVENTNRAVALADTRWVKLFCHDDLMRPDCLAQVAAAAAQLAGSRVALIGNGERHLFDNGYLSPGDADGPLLVMNGHDALRLRCSRQADQFVVPALTTATVRPDALFAQGGFDGSYVYFEIFRWYELLTEWDFAQIPGALTVNRIHGSQVASHARGTLRAAQDHRRFFAEFLPRHGAALGLGPLAKFYARMIAPGRAAGELVAELAAGRARRVPGMLRHVRLAWWPLLPLLMARAWRQDRRRLADLRGKVPMNQLYP